MEERNLTNHVIGNGDSVFHFSDVGITDHTKAKRYGRDLLLQLRLHPLSLQKPKNLPGMEVIKGKLYLQDINECSTSIDKRMDINNCRSLKLEHYNMKQQDFSSFPHYMNRLYPHSFPGYNGVYQSTTSKLRPLHCCCNPLKKYPMPSYQCYKDFSSEEEYIWTKQCLPTSGDLWNSHPPSQSYPGFTKKKENLEVVPKSKRKLAIIDPVTGKNILETITNIQEDQNSIYSVQKSSELSENHSTATTSIKGENAGDSFYNPKGKLHEKGLDCSTGKIYDSKSELILEDNKKKHPSSITRDDTANLTVDSNAMKENACGLVEKSGDKNALSDNPQYFNRKEPIICQNKAENIHADSYTRECNMEVCKENSSKPSGLNTEDLKPEDQLFCVVQEQQKMKILKGFLRYKKYQLEEKAKNLDEKGIEIANWECNLFNKAKRLHDKELWLENKSEMLNNKAQVLTEKERMMNITNNKQSGDCPLSITMLKESHLPEKFSSYKCSDISWDEIPELKIKFRNNGSNDYSYFGYTSSSSKILEETPSSIVKCKSDSLSLEQLEKDAAFVEKIHSANEVGVANIENETKLSSSGSMQKKDVMDPIGYSKGRRYLPEHIKYWLDNQDKNSI